jgi:hypothetical protein
MASPEGKIMIRFKGAHFVKDIIYCELGADYVDRIKADHLKRYFLKRLAQLGVQVTVQNPEHASTLPT